jgi:hypothetical protein
MAALSLERIAASPVLTTPTIAARLVGSSLMPDGSLVRRLAAVVLRSSVG